MVKLTQKEREILSFILEMPATTFHTHANKKLGHSEEEVKSCVNNLTKLGLIETILLPSTRGEEHFYFYTEKVTEDMLL
ncbi:MAG: hypothetical protein WCK90_03400 [archaeon]